MFCAALNTSSKRSPDGFKLIVQFIQIIHINVLQCAALFIPMVKVFKSEKSNIFVVVYFCDNEDWCWYGLVVTIPRVVLDDFTGGL